MRLRRRFALALVAVGLVLSATSLVGFTLYRDAVVAQEQSDLDRASESIATQLDVVLEEKGRLVRLQATDEPLGAHGTDAQAEALSAFVRQTTFSGASVIAANGTMTAFYARGVNETRRADLVGQSFEDRTYFQRAMGGETYVSDPIDAESGFRIVTVSTPIRDDGGDVVGTFNAAFHVRNGDFSEVVRTSSSGTRGVVVAADGQRVFSRGPTPSGSEAEFVANATVPSTGWTVSATSTRGAVESRLWAVTGIQAGAFVLVILSLAAFGWWLSREYVGNVERLSTGFESLVAGDYGARVSLSGSSEWTQLESQFNELSETLGQRRTEVSVLNRVLRHNLRNAMTVVVGNAERIAVQTDDEAVATEARRIHRRGESLLDLADHARAIESSLGDRADESTARPATAVLDEVLAVLADEFPDATVTSEVDDVRDARVPDGDLLVVVLDELGRNAVRHTDADSPRVEYEATADADTVRFTVRDDGPGLPPIERRVLTEPFVETPTQHGSGLGLWLVTWLVARVDGDVEATVDDGTTVTVTVPRVESGTDDASHDVDSSDVDSSDGDGSDAPPSDTGGTASDSAP